MKLTRPVAVLLALAVCAQGFAQPPPEPQAQKATEQTSGSRDADETVRITTNLVQVDFVVTDKQGNPVTNLKPEDIELFEDGRPQQISNFSYISTESRDVTTERTATEKSNPLPIVPVRRQNVRRTIAIVIDDLGLSFETLGPVKSALHKFIEQQMQPGDLVALMRTGGEVGALQQFTNDKRQLFAAIDRLRWNHCSRRGIHLFPPLREDGITYGDMINGTRGGGIGNADVTPICAHNAYEATLNSLKFILRGMRQLPGRKSVVIFSDSLPLDKVLDGPVPSMRFNNAGFAGSRTSEVMSYGGHLQTIAELAIRASTVIYAVDSRGLPGFHFSAADAVIGNRGAASALTNVMDARDVDMKVGREGSDFLAYGTGGFLVTNNNDMSLALGRILNDLRGYYLVGYRPNSETFNRRFHKLKVRLRNHPELTVRTRTGFYGLVEEEAQPKPVTVTDRFLLALSSPFATNEIDVQLTPTFTNESLTGSFLRTMLHIDTSKLAFRQEANGWQSTDLVLRGTLFGDNGKIVNEHRRQFTLRLRGATLKRIQSRGLDYVFNMPVKKPGAYQFRIAVLDPISGRIGSAGQFVEVPDIKKKRLVLSGLVIRGLVPADGLPAKPVTTTPADDASGLELTEASPAVRRFQQHMLLDYSYVVFNARYDKPTSRPQLTGRMQFFRDGKLISDMEIPVDVAVQIDPARAVSSGRLKLGDEFPPGQYVLQITVTDTLAPAKHQTATQAIDFEIVK